MSAYWRRRGWLAWNIALLGRAEFEHGFPALETLTGEAAPGSRLAQSDEMMAHNLRLWNAVLGSSLEVDPDLGSEGKTTA